MIKKTFILIPAILLFTACSDKTVQLQLDENKTKKLNSSTLSYNDYKSSYETQNQKLKNRPHSKYEPTISKDEYEKLSFNSNEINEAADSNSLFNKQSFIDFYADWKNVRYKMGGTSRTGIDCSGFTQKVFKEKFGIELPRTTLTQGKWLKPLKRNTRKHNSFYMVIIQAITGIHAQGLLILR